MIIGIGTDICDIRRIEKLIDKFGERFLAKIFTENERRFCNARSAHAECYAKRFAAKEAAAKALAGSDTGALDWHDVEIANAASGRPVIILHAGALTRAKQRARGKEWEIHLSLSDEPPYALAFVIFESM